MTKKGGGLEFVKAAEILVAWLLEVGENKLAAELANKVDWHVLEQRSLEPVSEDLTEQE